MGNGVMFGFACSMFMFFIPFLIVIWLRFKGIKQAFNAVIGLCIYFNFYYLLFNIVICNLIGSNIPGFTEFMSNPYSKVLVVVLLGGTLCEIGRYVGLRFGCSENHRWLDAFSAGLGYGIAASVSIVYNIINMMVICNYASKLISEGGEAGFIESVMEGGQTQEQAQLLLSQLKNLTFFDTALYMVQIATLIVVGVAVSILVLGAVRKDTFFKSNPVICIIIAVATHIFTDGIPMLIMEAWGADSRVAIIYLFVICVLAAVFVKLSTKFHPGESIVEVANLKKRKEQEEIERAANKHIAASAFAKAKNPNALEELEAKLSAEEESVREAEVLSVETEPTVETEDFKK